MIVDTSFVLDVIDGHEAAVQMERELEANSVPLVFPSMTVLELYIGVGKVASTQEERRAVEEVVESYPVVDTTPAIARRAGRLLGERMAGSSGGAGIGKGDAVIAATGIERGEPILTADDHFADIPGVTVESYR